MKPWWGALVGVVGLAALVAGCGSSAKHVTAPTSAAPGSTAAVGSSTAPPATTTGGSSSGPSVPATTAPGSTARVPTSGPSSSNAPVATTVPAAIRLCSTSQLAASLGSGNGAAGTIYYNLELHNASSVTCFVQGYPGVSFVAGSNGHQVGAPATRAAGATPQVVLAPQRSALASLAVVDAANYGIPCQLTPVLGLRVYPPNQTAALFVPHADQACANTSYTTLRIGPLQP